MKIHAWLKNLLKKTYGDKFKYIKSRAGIYTSTAGISDFICCIYGFYIAIEVKTIDNDLTELQQDFIDDVNKAGGLGVCMKGKDPQIITIINNHIRTRINYFLTTFK